MLGSCLNAFARKIGQVPLVAKRDQLMARQKTLRYFMNLVMGMQKQPLPVGYGDYLRKKNRALSSRCIEKGLCSPSGVLDPDVNG